MQKGAKISMMTLALFITGSIDSIRNLPSAAIFGSDMIFFFIFSALVFLIPTGLVSAQLSSEWPEEGGIYHWVRKAFGERWGFIAIWLQWINTMVWYPTILSFIAGTVAYFIDPALAANRYYLIGVILATFWLQTIINLKGLKTSARFASICAAVGMVLPMLLIILMGVVWVAAGKPIHMQFSMQQLVPELGKAESWFSLVAFIAAFLGMELATVHVTQVKNAQRNFPRALVISTVFILITMMLGSLSIAAVLPTDQIHLVDGVMEAFRRFLQEFHLVWLEPFLAVALVIGSVGGMVNWVISPAKGLLQAADHGFMPAWIGHHNQHDVPDRLLIIQAVLVSLLCAAFLWLPSINASYWLLTDLSTQLYVLMYILMFLAAWKLKQKFPGQKGYFSIPGGKSGLLTICSLGIFGCLTCLGVGFMPPETIHMSTPAYVSLFTVGLVGMVVPAVPFLYYKLRKSE